MLITKKLSLLILGFIVSVAGCRSADSNSDTELAGAGGSVKGKLSCDLEFDGKHYTSESKKSFESPRETPLAQYDAGSGFRMRKVNGSYEQVLSPSVDTSNDEGLYFLAYFTPRMTTSDKDTFEMRTQPLSGISGRGSVITSYTKGAKGQETSTTTFDLASMRVNGSSTLVLADQNPKDKNGLTYPAYRLSCRLTRTE